MCFNKDVSIISYFIGLTNCLILYLRGYEIEGIVYAFAIQMQLIEYLLWMNNSCNDINKFITKIGIILNHLQPIILYLLIVIYNEKLKNIYIHHIIIIIYIISFIIYFIYNYKLLNDCTIGIENKKELEWKIHNGKYNELYFIFLFALVTLTIIGLKKYKFLNGYLLLFIYVYSYVKYQKTKTIGTVWCLMAAYIPLILNILYLFDEYR